MLNSNENEHDDRERCIHCGEYGKAAHIVSVYEKGLK